MSRMALVLLVATMSLAGCGGSRSLPDDALAKAQSGVEVALQAWKKGDAPEKVSTQVQITEQDWKAGAKLLDFTIDRTEGLEGGNARCWVTLSLRDRKGKTTQRSVFYEVNLEKTPIVVARDPMN